MKRAISFCRSISDVLASSSGNRQTRRKVSSLLVSLDQCLHSVREGRSWMVLKNMRLAPYKPRIRARTSTNRDLLPGPVPNMAQTMPRYAYSFEEPRGGAAVVLGKAWRPWPVARDSSRRVSVWRSWWDDQVFEVSKLCFRIMIKGNRIYKKVEKIAFVVLWTAVPCEKRHDKLTR